MGRLPQYYALKDEWLASCTDSTRRSYATAIRQFEDWARPRKRFPVRAADITSADCLKWFGHLRETYGVARANGSSVSTTQTARSKFLALRSFLAHCERQGSIERNPARPIRVPSKGLGNPHRVLPLSAIPALLTAANEAIVDARAEIDHTPSSRERLRRAEQMRVILLVLGGTGCRLGELVSLRWMDVLDEAEPARIRLLVKGGKPHVVVVRPEVISAMRSQPRVSKAEEDYLFHDGTGRALQHRTVNIALAALCKRASLPKITTHSIRAMVATGLHAKGVPLIEIKNLLGHASVETTARYVRYAEEAKHSAGLKIDFLS
jgi:integrase